MYNSTKDLIMFQMAFFVVMVFGIFVEGDPFVTLLLFVVGLFGILFNIHVIRNIQRF